MSAVFGVGMLFTSITVILDFILRVLGIIALLLFIRHMLHLLKKQ